MRWTILEIQQWLEQMILKEIQTAQNKTMNENENERQLTLGNSIICATKCLLQDTVHANNLSYTQTCTADQNQQFYNNVEYSND